MNIKEIIHKHSKEIWKEQSEFERMIREETKNLSKSEAIVAIIKAIVEDNIINGYSLIHQVYSCPGRDTTIKRFYFDADRDILIDVDFRNGYIDLLYLDKEELEEIKKLLSGTNIICEW